MSEIHLDSFDNNVDLIKQYDISILHKESNIPLQPQTPKALIELSTPVKAVPPSWPKRWLCNLGIGVFSAFVYQYEWWEAAWIYIFGKNATSSQLRSVLVDLVQNGNTDLTAQVLQTYLQNKEEHDADDTVIADILKMEGVVPHLHEIFKGANVRLYGDNGAFFERWAGLSTAYTRWTSHDARLGKSRGLTGTFINEFHFWVDRKTGDTCFQVEKHPTTGPLGGLKNSVLHMIDYFRYVRDDEQQSTYGTSPHTDQRPIIIDASQL